jgi:hypothetical protein
MSNTMTPHSLYWNRVLARAEQYLADGTKREKKCAAKQLKRAKVALGLVQLH